jgi:YidC/Oxa1 family membrane protein insertase
MDRKGLIIIIVTVGIAIAWQMLYVKPKYDEEVKRYKEAREKYDAEQKRIAEAAPAKAASTPNAAPAAPAPAPVPAPEAAPIQEKTATISTEAVDYVFTNVGGGITRIVLKDHLVDKKQGTKVVLNEFGDIAIGALSHLPGDELFIRREWQMTPDPANRAVTFNWKDEQRNIAITKRFTLPQPPEPANPRREKLRTEYLFNLDVTFTNVGTAPMMVAQPFGQPVRDDDAARLFVHFGGAAPVNEGEVALYQGFDYHRDGDNHFQPATWFDGGGMLWWKRPPSSVFKASTDLIRWGAVTNQYFTTVLTAEPEKKEDKEVRTALGTQMWARRKLVSPEQWQKVTDWRPQGNALNGKNPIYQVEGALGVPDFVVTPQQEVKRSFQIYAGPRELRRLRLLDHDESEVLAYDTFLGIPTGPFSRLLLNSMNGLYYYVTKNYALAIVVLTILVKAILWPLQSKANKSMKKMAELQPQIKALQDKYKQDPVKFQQEMGKVWKKAGVNPLSGCWPIMIQIPIFIGFYNMLGKAVELRHHGFLWVQDLSAPDTVAHLFGLIPINPLPLLMAVTMFLQMKMAPQGGDPMQRRIFMFMPLIFILLCYNFASALALYWTVQNIISIVQLMINRSNQPVLAHAAPAK